jgi:hypothetical protein
LEYGIYNFLFHFSISQFIYSTLIEKYKRKFFIFVRSTFTFNLFRSNFLYMQKNNFNFKCTIKRKLFLNEIYIFFFIWIRRIYYTRPRGKIKINSNKISRKKRIWPSSKILFSAAITIRWRLIIVIKFQWKYIIKWRPNENKIIKFKKSKWK